MTRTTKKQKSEGGAEQYAGAFARVRLVRAWVAVTAAVVAMLYAYVALLERVVQWWASGVHRRRYWARAALLAMGLLATAVPDPLLAVDGRRATPTAGSRPRVSYVTITHSGNGTASVYTNNTGSTTFTVRNDGAPLTALFSASICTGNISSCSVSPTGPISRPAPRRPSRSRSPAAPRQVQSSSDSRRGMRATTP